MMKYFNMDDTQKSSNDMKVDLLKKDISYLFSKINWGASSLDARSIHIMNNINARIDEISK